MLELGLGNLIEDLAFSPQLILAVHFWQPTLWTFISSSWAPLQALLAQQLYETPQVSFIQELDEILLVLSRLG